MRLGCGERERENLNIHQVIHTDASKLRELLTTLLQELGNGVTLLTLGTVKVSEAALFEFLCGYAP